MARLKIQLPDTFIQQLTQLPESGMGYQRVKVVLKNGTVLYNHLVFNSSILQLNEGETLNPADIKLIELDNNKAA